MSPTEVTGKVVTFTVAAALFVVCGFLVLTGSHAANDYLNSVLGWLLILMGVGTAGFGAVSIGGILLDERQRRREASLHVTPRAGEPGPPPAWGMGDVGRVEVGDGSAGAGAKGGTRVMSVAVNNLDAPLLVGLLLAWTVVALILFSPK